MSAVKLSKRQQAVLDVIKASRVNLSGPQILERLGEPQGTPEGLHQTAASLVRHRLIGKGRVRGIVRYYPLS